VPPYFVVYAFTVPPAGFRLISMSRAAKSGQYAVFRALVHAGGTPHASDYYDLCGRGYRSVLMLDERYFLALTSPALTESRASLNTMLPLLKSMPSGTRALGFASLHPKGRATPFYDAASLGAARFVDFAVRYGASINMEGGPWGTPLMAACSAGHLPTVKQLVQSGALLSYWDGTEHISAFANAQPHSKILRWLLVGRFTETLRLTENTTGGDEQLVATVTTYGGANDVQVELVLEDDTDDYLEGNLWFVPARRFMDNGDGSFDAVDILLSEFTKYKPTCI
jgi:hypothetical protein